MGNAQQQTIPKLVIKKVIHAKRDRVFEAWTRPEMMKQWLVPPAGWTARTKNELRVGGRYHHEMFVGAAPTDESLTPCAEEPDYKPGDVLLHEGEYLEIKPPERLVFTGSSASVQNTRVTIDFRDLGDSTELWLTHELLETEHQRKSHSGGWEAALVKLEQLLTA